MNAEQQQQILGTKGFDRSAADIHGCGAAVEFVKIDAEAAPRGHEGAMKIYDRRAKHAQFVFGVVGGGGVRGIAKGSKSVLGARPIVRSDEYIEILARTPAGRAVELDAERGAFESQSGGARSAQVSHDAAQFTGEGYACSGGFEKLAVNTAADWFGTKWRVRAVEKARHERKYAFARGGFEDGIPVRVAAREKAKNHGIR